MNRSDIPCRQDRPRSWRYLFELRKPIQTQSVLYVTSYVGLRELCYDFIFISNNIHTYVSTVALIIATTLISHFLDKHLT